MLLETMVAITIITVIMSALTALYVTVIGSTNHERASQAGAQVADSALDKAHGVGAAGAVKGRGSSAVTLQFGSAPSSIKTTWLSSASMAQVSDSSVATTAGATATLPTVGVSQTVNNKAFTVNYYVGTCYRQTDGTCTGPAGGSTVQYVRIVVLVTWNDHTCGAAGCQYVTATLLNGAADPVFLFNQAPPSKPKLNPIADQFSSIGDASNGPTASTPTGVLPFAFSASGLPPGLVMGPGANTITGNPTTAGTYAVTVKVTDGFLNTDSTTFNWSVYPAMAVRSQADQSGDSGSAISPLTLATPTGGSGSFTWTDPSSLLPPGLTVSSAGVVSGTPTTANTFPVVLTVTDSKTGDQKTVSFTWTVVAAPTITTPVNASSTVNTTGTYNVQYTCPNTPCTFGITGKPTWLSLNSTTGVLTATATTVTTATGIQVSVTDHAGVTKTTASFTWTVNAKPTITTPGTQLGLLGVVDTYSITATCGSTPCTYTLSGAPSGATIGATTGVITIPAATAAGTYTGLTVTITDKYGATAVTSAFSWVISNPAWNSIPNQSTKQGAKATALDLSTYAKGGSGSYKYTVSGLPTGLSLSGSTISGTPTGAKKAYTITVTISDNAGTTGGSTVSTTFTWTVS